MFPANIEILQFLGKGKSGISYLAKYAGKKVVYKQMHDEPVSYYFFSKPKVELELEAYSFLEKQDIRIPKLITFDHPNQFIIKEYIEGKTISEVIAANEMKDSLLFTMLSWESKLKEKGINIDYFPSNFVLNNDEICYIDYELNPYSEEWNYRNWGIYYWLNALGMKKYLETQDHRYINYENTGIPLKTKEIEDARKRVLA